MSACRALLRKRSMPSWFELEVAMALTCAPCSDSRLTWVPNRWMKRSSHNAITVALSLSKGKDSMMSRTTGFRLPGSNAHSP